MAVAHNVPAKIDYEADFAAWAEHQAALVRAARFRDLDLENIAEELESLGRAQRNAIESHLRNVVMHLLKWRHQPARRSRSWRSSISNGRIEIAQVLRNSPSLRSVLPEALHDQYRNAVRLASIETGLAEKRFPDACPFTLDQILDPDFLPEG